MLNKPVIQIFLSVFKKHIEVKFCSKLSDFVIPFVHQKSTVCWAQNSSASHVQEATSSNRRYCNRETAWHQQSTAEVTSYIQLSPASSLWTSKICEIFRTAGFSANFVGVVGLKVCERQHMFMMKQTVPPAKRPSVFHGCNTCLSQHVQSFRKMDTWVLLMYNLLHIVWNRLVRLAHKTSSLVRHNYYIQQLDCTLSTLWVTQIEIHRWDTGVHVLKHCFKCRCRHIWKINRFIWTICLKRQREGSRKTLYIVFLFGDFVYTVGVQMSNVYMVIRCCLVPWLCAPFA